MSQLEIITLTLSMILGLSVWRKRSIRGMATVAYLALAMIGMRCCPDPPAPVMGRLRFVPVVRLRGPATP
jgi:hypothetical protein